MRATLFETLRLYTPDGEAIDPGSPTTRSLLAYLLLNRSRPSDRRRLAFTFWPEATESAARRNLRQYLHHLRSALEPIDPDNTLLLADGSSIQLNPQIEISLDVDTFQYETRPEASTDEIEHALSLYSGDLLEDNYDDWCGSERERLRQVWLGTLDRYSQILQSTGNISAALAIIQEWVKAEPFDENAQRRLMSLYALTGERAKAIQTYHRFARSLEQELETEPLPETQALLQTIQNGQALVESETPEALPSQRSTPKPRALTFPALPFIGRQNEIAPLETAYQHQPPGTCCGLLVSCFEGGNFVLSADEGQGWEG